MGYKHLTIEQRSQVYALKSNNHSQKDIAAHIEVDESTVSRELKRNTGIKGYRYKQAHEAAMARRHCASAALKKWTLKVDRSVEDGPKEQHSPEQISGRLKLININISHERICQHIHDDKVSGGTLYKELRRRDKKYNYKRGAKYAGRGCIPNRVDISMRPKVVERKSRLGDWEGDTIIKRTTRVPFLAWWIENLNSHCWPS